MFSSKRPSVNVLGEASLTTESQTPQYHSYADRVTHAHMLGMLRNDDPRLGLDPQEINQLRLRSHDGLINAAMKTFNGERSDDRMPTAQAADKAALVRSALTASLAQTPEQADTDPAMGEQGILARNLEKAALAIHHQHPKDPGVKRILTLAAAAHNAGAAAAAVRGFENNSIIEAAAKQGRDPVAVVRDLATHGHLDATDIRKTISNADIPTSPKDALETTRPQRPRATDTSSPSRVTETIIDSPIMMLSQARQAEGRAMALAMNAEGSDFDKQTRQQQAQRLLAAAFSVERHRQDVSKARQADTTKSTQRPAPSRQGNAR